MHDPNDGSSASELRSTSVRNQWLFWFITMAITGGSLVAASQAGYLNHGLYGSMGFLGFVMTIKCFQDARFCDRESRLASEQVSILEEVDDFQEFFECTQPSLFRQHIHNLFVIGHRHGRVTQDALISLLHTKLQARTRVVSLSASVLVTYGLIGTILGLMVMMSKLSEQVGSMADSANGDFIGTLFGEDGALSGLDTAFITTLIGAALGGVLLRVLTSVVEASITRYSAFVAQLTEVYVLPALWTLASDAQSTEGEGGAA
ncbi:MAG: MotA/TolQ/ExbB proton channel family protein [Planctomycetota bacterium]